MTAMRIALTMRVTRARDYDEPRDSISHDWIDRLRRWDMTPLPVPNRLGDPCGYLDALAPDLLVLTGGDDPGTCPPRDETEQALLVHALGRGLPVLGVCRGLQLANGQFGGALSPVSGHVARRHRVRMQGAFAALYGAETEVNSYHALGVRPAGLGRELFPTAVDEAGAVEAFCHRDRALAAVMWHPERDAETPGDRALIERLAEDGAFWR